MSNIATHAPAPAPAPAPAFARSRAPLRWLAEAAAFTGVVFFAYTLVPHPREAAIWWPPIGAVVAWLLTRPRRDWPLVIALAWVIRIAVAVAMGREFAHGAWVIAGSIAAGVCSALLLRRYLGARAPFSEPYDIVAFAVVAVCFTGPFVAASTALMRMAYADSVFNWLSPVHRSLSESVGVILIAPFLLTLGSALAWWRSQRWIGRLEFIAQLLASLGFGVVVMLVPAADAEARRPFMALMAVPSAWGAARFGLFAVVWSQLITGSIASWGLIHGRGVIAALPIGLERQSLQLQLWMLVSAVVIMLAAGAFASQRRSVARARASEARFRRLVESAPVGMLVEGGEEGEAPYHNPRLAALLGPLEPSDTTAAWWQRAGASDDVMLRLTDAARVASLPGAPAPKPISVELMGADRVPRQIELHVSAAGDRSITAFVDLTERVRLEGELRQSHKLEALGTLAGGVAHDFNNILATMLGNLELIRQGVPAGHETRAMIDDATAAGKRATETVRKVLAFSQQQEQERGVLALSELFHDAAAQLKSDGPANVTVQVAEGRDVPQVLGDATQLTQVLMNLGANALHAMRAGGGTLSLALEKVDVTPEMVRRHPELKLGRYARLTVGDTGTGMSAATLERIFEPFFTTKHPGEGTGLGLALVHGVVHSHDGAIIARSAPGQGTWFGVYLPATVETVPWQMTSDEGASLEGTRTLVLDDEPALGRLVRRVITRAGCACVVVNTAAEALAVLADPTERVDLMLTDLTMPDRTGLEVAADARRVRPELPVLLMTGYSATLSSEALKTDGIAGVVQKPFTPEEMLRAIHEVRSADPASGTANL